MFYGGAIKVCDHCGTRVALGGNAAPNRRNKNMSRQSLNYISFVLALSFLGCAQTPLVSSQEADQKSRQPMQPADMIDQNAESTTASMPDRSESNTENGAEDELSTSCTTDIDCALSEICAEGLCSATDERDHRGSEALLEPLRGYAELCRNNCERAIVCGSPEHLSAEECIDFNCTVVANLKVGNYCTIKIDTLFCGKVFR